jgi:hypothetical protein
MRTRKKHEERKGGRGPSTRTGPSTMEESSTRGAGARGQRSKAEGGALEENQGEKNQGESQRERGESGESGSQLGHRDWLQEREAARQDKARQDHKTTRPVAVRE